MSRTHGKATPFGFLGAGSAVLIDEATAPAGSAAVPIRAAGTILGFGGAPVAGVPLTIYDGGTQSARLGDTSAGYGALTLYGGATQRAYFGVIGSDIACGSSQGEPFGLTTSAIVRLRLAAAAAEAAVGLAATVSGSPLSLVVGASAHEGARVGGRIYEDHATHATTGLTLETLDSFSLPANALNADGKGIRLTICIGGPSVSSDGTYQVSFGATPVATTGALAAGVGNIWLTVDVVRTGAATQRAIGARIAGGSPGSLYATPAEALSGAVTVAVQATTPTTIGDIALLFWRVEFLN